MVEGLLLLKILSWILMVFISFSTTNKLEQASPPPLPLHSTQVCDYGDFVDGQCSTTTVTSPATETTTTALAEDFGMHFVFGDLRTTHDERSIINTIIITI